MGKTIRYGIDWDSNWTWEQLAVKASPDAISRMGVLRGSIAEAQARKLLQIIAHLPEPFAARKIVGRTLLDRKNGKLQAVKYELDKVFTVVPYDNLDGMLLLAVRLTNARIKLRDPFVPDPPDMPVPPLPHAVSIPVNLNIVFDFTPAERLLEALDSKAPSNSLWEALADLPVYGDLLLHHNGTMLKREELMEWWRRAADKDPVNRLYEWVYPGSYYDFGGVAVNASLWRDHLKRLKENQQIFKQHVAQRLIRFLPKDLKVDANVRFLFAADVDGWATADSIGLDLEHFGNDYGYLARVVAHEIWHRAQMQGGIDADREYRTAFDRAFVNQLLGAVWREGTASYIGSVWPEPPSTRQLASDYAEFEGIYDDLYVKHNLTSFRDRIHKGLEMAGAFYRMGWRMSQVIEKYEGAKGLSDSLTLGPTDFFRRYLEACVRLKGEDIGPEERLRSDIASTIQRMISKTDAPSLLKAASILRLPTRIDRLREARLFLTRYGKELKAGQAMVMLGDRLVRKDGAGAGNISLIRKGLSMMGSKSGDRVRREGELLLSLGKSSDAFAIFKEGVQTDSMDPARWQLLGEYYRTRGDYLNAEPMFKRAISLNPDYQPARKSLDRMGRR